MYVYDVLIGSYANKKAVILLYSFFVVVIKGVSYYIQLVRDMMYVRDLGRTDGGDKHESRCQARRTE